MEKDTIILIIAISIGLAILLVGFLLNNLILIVIGPITSILLFIFSYIKVGKERKEKMYIPEDKYETILSLKSKQFKRRPHYLGTFMAIIFAIVIFSIIWFFVTRALYRPNTPLSLENVINDGCRKLNTGTGRCEKDPSTIIVDFDVNGDGVVGGENDTLSNLLLNQSCTGSCIRRRCSCID